MSKERLEEFKKFIDYLYDSLDMEDHQRFDDTVRSLIRDRWFDWVYRYAKKQADRVQELEKRLKIYQKRSWFEDYEKVAKQNKRYREALEFYALGRHWITSLKDGRDYVNEYGELAEKALEGEE